MELIHKHTNKVFEVDFEGEMLKIDMVIHGDLYTYTATTVNVGTDVYEFFVYLEDDGTFEYGMENTTSDTKCNPELEKKIYTILKEVLKTKI